jgi:hypothetical protein
MGEGSWVGLDVHARSVVARVAMRIDTDDVVQLICKHLSPASSRALGDDKPVSVWGGKPRAAGL